MSLSIFVNKYIKQIKALSPDYDAVFTHCNDSPIEFCDRENIRLSFAAIADTHLVNKESATVNLNNFFDDIACAEGKTDAVLMAGDIAEYGRKCEYRRFFDVFDKYKNTYKIFLTMGNHDARLQYTRNRDIIMAKVSEYLRIKTNAKSYYSYDVNGYTFIILCTEKRILEKAFISDEQINFLEHELKRNAEKGNPVFIMCHQPFAQTHGLPEVWKTGDMGEQSEAVRKVTEKFKNVFFINGHLHGGVFEKTLEVLNKDNNVFSLSIPGYRKENNFGITDCGVGYFAEIYDDKVIFTARNFTEGKKITGNYSRFEIALI